MAVDFSLLPPEEPLPDNPPSRFVWMIVFFALVLAGALAVLLLWPKNMPTHTWKFWTCLILFPVGIPAWIVVRRYISYETRKLDVALRNEAARDYREQIFAAASIPLALVGAAYRFSSDPKENCAAGITAGSVKLSVQSPIARDGEPVKARWLFVPGVKLSSENKEDDCHRHREATKWLFTELLDALADSMRALPAHLELDVHLAVMSELDNKENEALWRECWREHPFRQPRIAETPEQAFDLNTLDIWLDQLIEGPSQRARLIVAAQLHPLMKKTPPTGTAEAGVALLLMPDALAIQHQVARMANLYRPVRGSGESSDESLAHALKWADVAGAEIAGAWQTGLDVARTGALQKDAERLGLAAPTTDLDQTVGHTGIAAPWLAIACAAEILAADAQRQIVFAGQAESTDYAVVQQIA